jgi:hypothetical protein
VIAEWRRNRREVIKVALDEYQGNATINARVWFHGDEGFLSPTKSGLTLGLAHLPQLSRALADAEATAARLGLLKPAMPRKAD